MEVAFELFVILFLVLLNGVFAMSELALVSVRERCGAAGRPGARPTPYQNDMPLHCSGPGSPGLSSFHRRPRLAT